MTSSSITSAAAQAHATAASSTPPLETTNSECVSKAMQKEEERMKTQREKSDAKRDAQLEQERREDLQSGKDVLDKKFQQLEFLMNKSKVGGFALDVKLC